jgi:hypothetical protein
MATGSAHSPQFRRDAERSDNYFKLSDEPVAYSIQLSDLVIADYDPTGAVRGIEFVGKRIGSIDGYLEKARSASRGPLRKRPKVPTEP